MIKSPPYLIEFTGVVFLKISEFCKKASVSKDTVRYYIETGMLIPKKVNGQYFFDDNDINDMEYIIKFKKLRFTVSEIQKIMSMTRISGIKSESSVEFYIDILRKKKENLRDENENINKAIEDIDKFINELYNMKKTFKRVERGLKIEYLGLLTCPECGKNLRLNSADILNSEVMNGILKCQCGYSAEIIDGIIKTNEAMNIYKENFSDEFLGFVEKQKNNSSDLRENYYKYFFSYYVEKNNTEFISYTEKAKEWVINSYDFEKAENKIIFEFGTGQGIFLYSILDKIKKGNVFVVTDIFFENIMFVKKTIEALNVDFDIIYLNTDIRKCPFKEKSADIILDIFSTTNFNLYLKDDSIKYLKKFVNPETIIYGNYLAVEKRGIIKKENREYEKFFLYENEKENIERYYEIKQKPVLYRFYDKSEIENFFEKDSEKIIWCCSYGEKK